MAEFTGHVGRCCHAGVDVQLLELHLLVHRPVRAVQSRSLLINQYLLTDLAFHLRDLLLQRILKAILQLLLGFSHILVVLLLHLQPLVGYIRGLLLRFLVELIHKVRLLIQTVDL